MKKKNASGARTDFLILLFVLALTAAGVIGVRALLYGPKEDTPPARIVIRVEGVQGELADGVHEGERVIDRTNRRLLGTVSEVRRTPSLTEIATDTEDTEIVARVGLVDMDLALIPDHDHHGYFVVPRVWQVGTSVTFATPSFAATGTIIRIER